MIGKILVGILCLFLLLAAFASPISDGIKGWRTIDTSYAAVITTGAGVITANVTLPSNRELYQAVTSEVQSVTSNETGDAPVASSYDEDTRKLLISGLAESLTRTLTIDYYAETDDTVMRVIGPFLGVLIIGGCVAAIFYGMFGHKGR